MVNNTRDDVDSRNDAKHENADRETERRTDTDTDVNANERHDYSTNRAYETKLSNHKYTYSEPTIPCTILTLGDESEMIHASATVFCSLLVKFLMMVHRTLLEPQQ